MKPSAAEIFFSEYELRSNFFWNSRTQSNSRLGVLIKIQFSKDIVGYSSYSPWPELGDETLEEGLIQFQNGSPTSLMNQAFYWADVDAKARAEKINLRAAIKPLKSHFLINDIHHAKFDPQFSTFKIKMGRDLAVETEFLQSNLVENRKFRLDFNGSMNFSDFIEWFSTLPQEIKDVVDFVEDPFNPETVEDEKELSNPLWAWDFYQNKVPGASTVIVKPTRSLKTLSNVKRRVFTHSFDHPIGRIACLYSASQAAYAEKEIHGLNYSGVECSDQSHKDLSKQGTGFGFDELLKKTKWTKL